MYYVSRPAACAQQDFSTMDAIEVPSPQGEPVLKGFSAATAKVHAERGPPKTPEGGSSASVGNVKAINHQPEVKLGCQSPLDLSSRSQLAATISVRRAAAYDVSLDVLFCPSLLRQRAGSGLATPDENPWWFVNSSPLLSPAEALKKHEEGLATAERRAHEEPRAAAAARTSEPYLNLLQALVERRQRLEADDDRWERNRRATVSVVASQQRRQAPIEAAYVIGSTQGSAHSSAAGRSTATAVAVAAPAAASALGRTRAHASPPRAPPVFYEAWPASTAWGQAAVRATAMPAAAASFQTRGDPLTVPTSSQHGHHPARNSSPAVAGVSEPLPPHRVIGAGACGFHVPPQELSPRKPSPRRALGGTSAAMGASPFT
jgi:hypothetical protein